MIRDIRLDVTTAAGGSGDATSAESVNGLVLEVIWIDGGFADGVDAVLSVVNTPSGVDETILTLTDANVDKIYRPRLIEHDTAGADLTTYTYPTAVGKLKLAVTSGGAVATGGCIVRIVE